MDTLETFIKKSKLRHGDLYDYSKVDYIDSKTKVCIICKKHGEFWQLPSSHIRGYGCPKCGNHNRGSKKRFDTNGFIEKARAVHGDRYDYSKVEYVNSKTKVCITCPEHGEFWQLPMSHLIQKSGCPKCAGMDCTTEDFIKKAREVHGDEYDYSLTKYEKAHKKVCITCREHGEFWQTPSKHLLGQGCKKCSDAKKSLVEKLTTDEFVERAKEIHGDRYDYSSSIYDGAKSGIVIGCNIHGHFIQKPNDHLSGHGCPVCGKNMSISEIEIKEYVESLGIVCTVNDRSVLDGMEIDIFVPSHRVGIEFDGLYWHSELYKDKNYHLRKTEECNRHGIRLIHVFEDEWVNKKDIVKSIISNSLGKTENRIFARKCEIKVVDSATKSAFLDENHIQGNVGSRINIGLYFCGELVSFMCFGPRRTNMGGKNGGADGEYEMLRFCNKLNTTVIGGSGRLLEHFKRVYCPKKIVSYCDRRYGTGNMYEKTGFVLDHYSKPNYFYIEGNNRKNRFKYRKDELVRDGFDSRSSERKIMLERKIYRIYDCGTIVYVWNNPKS